MAKYIIVEQRKHEINADTGQQALDDWKTNGTGANGYVNGGINDRYVTDDDGDFETVTDSYS